MEDVLSHADGYFSESLTNDHAYWNSQPNSRKRNGFRRLRYNWLTGWR